MALPVDFRLSHLDRVRGCLLGGAVGDALGAGIEFLSLQEIRDQFGAAGVDDYVPAYGRIGAITDDTQMTLFTAEGVLRAAFRAGERGFCHPPSVIHHAYLRWLLTQGERPAKKVDILTDGWLYATAGLHQRRAPGNTCLSALRAATDWGQPARAANDSKGCGGVMRVAPIGLASPTIEDKVIFETATASAALTHGHPAGHLSAGYFAVLIAALVRGEPLKSALKVAEAQLIRHRGNREVMRAIRAARDLARRGIPGPEDLETLGGGWVAEEALSIAICCALVARDFGHGVLLAVNHSGDSDSTGSMTGNILGAVFGVNAIPRSWLDRLELRAEIDRIAADLDAFATDRQIVEQYPPN